MPLAFTEDSYRKESSSFAGKETKAQLRTLAGDTGEQVLKLFTPESLSLEPMRESGPEVKSIIV